MNNFNLLWRLLKFSFPFSAILFPLVAIYGYLQPWQPATLFLSSFAGQSPVMVGFSYRAQNQMKISSRSYILVPSVFSEPKVVVIQKINDSNPTITFSFSSFWLLAGWFFISLIGTWWFWIRGVGNNHLTHHSSGTPNGAP